MKNRGFEPLFIYFFWGWEENHDSQSYKIDSFLWQKKKYHIHVYVVVVTWIRISQDLQFLFWLIECPFIKLGSKNRFYYVESDWTQYYTESTLDSYGLFIGAIALCLDVVVTVP